MENITIEEEVKHLKAELEKLRKLYRESTAQRYSLLKASQSACETYDTYVKMNAPIDFIDDQMFELAINCGCSDLDFLGIKEDA